MFIYYEDTGMMVRASDGVVVQPVTDQAAYEEYVVFLQSGGVPTFEPVMPQE